jgi:hypothetical protein
VSECSTRPGRPHTSSRRHFAGGLLIASMLVVSGSFVSALAYAGGARRDDAIEPPPGRTRLADWPLRRGPPKSALPDDGLCLCALWTEARDRRNR